MLINRDLGRNGCSMPNIRLSTLRPDQGEVEMTSIANIALIKLLEHRNGGFDEDVVVDAGAAFNGDVV